MNTVGTHPPPSFCYLVFCFGMSSAVALADLFFVSGAGIGFGRQNLLSYGLCNGAGHDLPGCILGFMCWMISDGAQNGNINGHGTWTVLSVGSLLAGIMLLLYTSGILGGTWGLDRILQRVIKSSMEG